jgi:sialate O-acetylesterase
MQVPRRGDCYQLTARADGADREVADARFSRIRLFLVEHKVALKPTDDVTSVDGWRAVTPESVAHFSAVAYFFGRELHQRYHIPIGLIDSSWRGTLAEAWVSEGSLKQLPEFQPSINFLKTIDEPAAIAEHQKYLKTKSEWYEQHRRGMAPAGLTTGPSSWLGQLPC